MELGKYILYNNFLFLFFFLNKLLLKIIILFNILNFIILII